MNKGSVLRLAASAAAALVVAGCGEVRAADPPAAAPAAASAPAKDAPAAPPRDTAAAPAAKPADGKPTPMHFEPTEKTRADFEVSFPSDI